VRWVSFGTAVPVWSSFLADARHLPHGRSPGGDRHLNFYGNRDNLLGRARPILIPRGGPRPWRSYQGSAPGLFPQDRARHLRERPTDGHRYEPLGSDGVWTKRGPSRAERTFRNRGRSRGLGCLCAMIPPHDHPRRPAAARPAVAADPTAAAPSAIPRPRWRASHRLRPRLHGRDHLHGPHLHPMGAAAGRRVRLRQRDQLLAAVRRMGGRWGVRAAPGGPVERTRHRRPAGLVTGQRGLLQPARRSGGTTPAQTQSTGPSAGPSCTWPLRRPGCRCRCW
jgi:hypothetical protein